MGKVIEHRPIISREMVKAERDKVFVFGDNMIRSGMGGQARAMRGEINSIGIATKRAPTMEGDAFFTDRLEEFSVVIGDLKKVAEAAAAGKTIIWPSNGIGTGLARLQYTSPKIYKVIQAFEQALKDYNDVPYRSE